MEEGTKTKKTIFVGGIGDDVDESTIYETFFPFGEILEVQLPSAATNPNLQSDGKHRGFAFVTYTSAGDAQDAIDNMDLNEMRGRVLKVNLARPQKTLMGAGNRPVWESEEWLRQNAKPLAKSGGVGARAALRAGGEPTEDGLAEEAEGEDGGADEPMED